MQHHFPLFISSACVLSPPEQRALQKFIHPEESFILNICSKVQTQPNHHSLQDLKKYSKAMELILKEINQYVVWDEEEVSCNPQGKKNK